MSLTTANKLAACIAGCALAAGAIASGGLGYKSAPWPFVWLDVAVVCFIAALPLAALLTIALFHKRPRHGAVLAVCALELAVLIVVPRLYIHARCRRDLAQIDGLLAQSRFGEARLLVHRVLALERHAVINGTPLSVLAAEVDRVVEQIEARVAVQPHLQASNDALVEQARYLAMLGRVNEALGVLGRSPALDDHPPACNLRGTIYETQEQWRLARYWYARGNGAWAAAHTTDNTAGQAQALIGIALCERKLGRIGEAETNWQELLRLSPTADSHFLAAQFYEDTQQAAKALHHANIAAQLAPERYKRAGQELIDKLQTSHFGCLGVFRTSPGLNR